MQDDSNAKGVDVQVIYLVFFVICNDLWSHITRRSAFGENNCWLTVKGSQSIVHDLEAVLTIVLIKRVFVLKKNIFWLDIPMHNALFLKVLYPRQNLFDN